MYSSLISAVHDMKYFIILHVVIITMQFLKKNLFMITYYDIKIISIYESKRYSITKNLERLIDNDSLLDYYKIIYV